MKKKILILFPEGNLPYSPTTINLINFLSAQFEVKVLANSCNTELLFGNNNVNLVPINTISNRGRLQKLFLKIIEKLKLATGKIIYEPALNKICKQVAGLIKSFKPDKVIAIDLLALACCAQLSKSCTFLSLEIPSSGAYFSALDFEKIEAVIIQRVDRYNYLFREGMRKPPFFVLPNAPVYSFPERRTAPSNKLIYNGYIWSAFGPQFCLNLVTRYPEYELHLKGVVHPEDMLGVYYPHLLTQPNFKMDSAYLSEPELKNYLADFSIGFCFYHFEHPFIKENRFNYETGPSGKLFTYLSAGLPVICSDIAAFKIVRDAGAGILINNNTPDTLKAAIEEILDNYQAFSDNALQLASDNCFRTQIQPVLEYLEK